MESIRSNIPDISHFEKKFREIIYEHQQNTKELNNLEKECLLLREELCSKDHLLQNEQKISNELKIRLKLASETIVRLEEENMHNKIDYSNLSMNYETLLKESDVLTKEALSCQTEAAKVKLKITSLENILRREILQKEKLEQALIKLKNDYQKITANIDINIAKIAKEQQYLLESSKAAIQLNRRLQTFGLCSHAINERNKANIRELQHKLTALSVNEFNKLPNNSISLHPEMENLCFKLKEMLTNFETKMQDPVPFEEKLDRIFNEMSTNLT